MRSTLYLDSTSSQPRQLKGFYHLTRYRWNFSAIFYGIIPSNPVAHLGRIQFLEQLNLVINQQLRITDDVD